MRRSPSASALLAIALFLIAPAVAEAGWEKLSPDDVSITSAPDVDHVSGAPGAAAVLWPATPATDSVARTLELRTIFPTLAHPAAGAGPLATPVTGWNALGSSAVFANIEYDGTNMNDSFLLFEGFDHNGDGAGGTYTTPPVAGDSPELTATKVTDERSGDLDAVIGRAPNGNGILWADSSRGLLTTYRTSGEPAVPQSELQTPLGGCCAYHPTVAKQADGTPWVAWYSSASSSLGLQMAPLDPATGRAAGPTVKVPGSETVANNFARLPMACRETCRIFYAIQPNAAGPTKLASWAPGDAAPTLVRGVVDLTLNGVIAAAPSSSPGKTWVAWYDRGASGSAGGYRAKLGDDRGSGGMAVAIAKPAASTAFGPLLATSRDGEQLLLTAVAAPSGPRGGAVWLDVITPKGDPAIPNTSGIPKARVVRAGNAIAVASGIQSVRGIKRSGVRVGVQSSQPGKATLVLCQKRPGHPPSPCRSRSAPFAEPGFATIRIPPGPPVRGARALELTLKAGGKSKSLSLKLRR